jgi:hypothetical protein
MDPINNVNQLVETLRRQLIDAQNKTGATSRTPSQTNIGATSGQAGVEVLQQKIREKLRRIDSGDPKAAQKSVHIFLESVLLWEFGERLMEDPKFYALLDEVQISMESDPAVREDLSMLISQLR